MDIEALEVVIVQHEAVDCKTIEETEININNTIKWIKRVKNAYPEADLIVFPECGIQGGDPDPSPDITLTMESQAIQRLCRECRDYAVWCVFNVLEVDKGKVYNTSLLVDDKGEIAIKYRKVNTFAPLERNTPGKEFFVCSGPKGAVFGLMTCYDGDFPEVSRELALLGANVLLRPSSYMEPFSPAWQFTNRARAYENTAYMIACNRCGTTELFTWFGSSEADDFNGNVLAKLPPGEEWMTKVTIYPGLASQARDKKTVGNHLYNLYHRGNTPDNPEGDRKNPYRKTRSLWGK
jgi:predicted amidohydrolase